MNKSKKIAFVIEENKTEPQIIYNIKEYFFKGLDVVPIILPNATNIYTLWEKIKEDDEETDIIEIVKEEALKQDQNQSMKKIDRMNKIDFRKMNRDEFSEVYLFFDYDGHNDNLPKDKNPNDVLKSMLKTFDNETENGKMYISYPMVEAIKDYSIDTICHEQNNCFSNISIGRNYKKQVSDYALINDFKRLDIIGWKFIIQKYINSCYCLLDIEHSLTKKEFVNRVTPTLIFDKQRHKYINRYGYIMVLSAFPEFLIDYFKEEVLERYLNSTKLFNRKLIIECKQLSKTIDDFSFEKNINY
nr:hypothetical protein [uncultured Faecalibacillus sp.]